MHPGDDDLHLVRETMGPVDEAVAQIAHHAQRHDTAGVAGSGAARIAPVSAQRPGARAQRPGAGGDDRTGYCLSDGRGR